MTEGLAYITFLTIVGVALVVMTVGFAAIGIMLARQNRKANRSSQGRA